MEGERIGQAMRPILCRRNAFDLELDPIAIFEVMDTPIEGKEEFKAVVDIPPCISYHHMIIISYSGSVKSAALRGSGSISLAAIVNAP